MQNELTVLCFTILFAASLKQQQFIAGALSRRLLSDSQRILMNPAESLVILRESYGILWNPAESQWSPKESQRSQEKPGEA